MTHNEITAAYVAAFVDGLAKAGIAHAVVSPGSRSTPLAMMLAEHPDIRVWIHVDERSAGFFALGMAKASRKPVVLVCSSGTATANYYPAVVEASQSHVPLIVCTADRPHELRDVGAPQAIQQIQLFGSYAKWFMEMALPEASPDMLRYVRTTAGRAVSVASNGPAGPVHLNFPFREPLTPEFDSAAIWESGLTQSFNVAVGKRELQHYEMKRFVEYFQSSERGIIIVGPAEEMDTEFANAVTRLAAQFQYPIFADPLSQLRTGVHDKSHIMDGYDSFLRNRDIVTRMKPDVIIRFGAMPVSKAFLQYVKHHSSSRQIVIDPDGGWLDPTHQVSNMVYADPVLFCEDALRIAREQSQQGSQQPNGSRNRLDSNWFQDMRAINQITQDLVHKGSLQIDVEDDLFEGRVFTELMNVLPDGSALFVGNSMPVRDLDTFFMNQETSIRVFANRGANGIDGIVSTALGVSSVLEPLVLVIGDLSFYHDLNGLLAAKLHQLNCTIIVVNNDGGGIFSFLPQSNQPKHFEMLFGTPLNLDFQGVVEMYGGTFTRLKNWDSFRQEVASSITRGGLKVVEVPTQRHTNVELHRRIWEAAHASISKYLDVQKKEGQ